MRRDGAEDWCWELDPPECYGSEFTWLVSEAVQGLVWLADYNTMWYGTDSKLSFFVPNFSVPEVEDEPISLGSDQDSWIDEVFTDLGYMQDNAKSQGFAYNNDRRHEYGLDWFFSALMVRNRCDSDHCWDDQSACLWGFAKDLYGPYLVQLAGGGRSIFQAAATTRCRSRSGTGPETSTASTRTSPAARPPFPSVWGNPRP